MSGSTRWLVGVGVLIGVIIVAAVAVTALAGDEHEFAEGTPERVVQRYIAAITDGDTRAASDLMTANLRARCDQFAKGAMVQRSERTIRATLDRSVERDGTAQVYTRVTERFGNSDPFSSGEHSTDIVFELTREDGAWRLSEAQWPYYCSMRGGPAGPVAPAGVPPSGPAPATTATAAGTPTATATAAR